LKKIVIAGEIYSTNIGDSVIYEALRYLFKRQVPDCEIVPIDISGRKQIATGQYPGLKRKTFQFAERNLGLAYSIANGTLQMMLNHKRHKVIWKPALDGASALVIGGGQLLMDNHLGFPVKLFGLAKTALDLKVPIHVTACGVGQPLSWVARYFFKFILSNARTITLRESLSQTRLSSQLPRIPSEVTFDPAIYADAIYDIPHSIQPQPLIGLCVINRWDVNFHYNKKQRFNENQWMRTWLELILELSRRGLNFQIFTTGTPSDDSFANKLNAAAHDQFGIYCPVAPRPTSTLQLVHTLRQYSGIIATRLHATIIANSFHIPGVGLSWDQKIKAYFKDTGQPDNCFDLSEMEPSAVVQCCQDAIRTGMDFFTLSRYQEKADRNIHIILNHAGDLN